MVQDPHSIYQAYPFFRFRQKFTGLPAFNDLQTQRK